jgi:hypothetical protein
VYHDGKGYDVRQMPIKGLLPIERWILEVRDIRMMGLHEIGGEWSAKESMTRTVSRDGSRWVSMEKDKT